MNNIKKINTNISLIQIKKILLHYISMYCNTTILNQHLFYAYTYTNNTY